MGSSSSLTCGLLIGPLRLQGPGRQPRRRSPELACKIEIDILGKPIGRQDQYAAAYGGLNYFRFNPDDTVDAEPVPCKPETLDELERRTLLLYTGTDPERRRDPRVKQSSGTADKMTVLRAMRDLADEMRRAIAGAGDLDAFAELLHQGWELKKSLGFGISVQAGRRVVRGWPARMARPAASSSAPAAAGSSW